VDIDASQLEDLHWFNKRELDQFFRHSFRETTVGTTRDDPLLLGFDSSPVQETGVSVFQNLMTRTAERSTLLRMGRVAHSNSPSLHRPWGWIRKHYSSSPR
jgi:hypothetical protein